MDLLLVFIDLFRTKSVVHSLLLRPDFMIETCIYVPYKKEHLYDKLVFSFQTQKSQGSRWSFIIIGKRHYP